MHLQNIFSHTSRRIFASKNVYLHLNQNTLYYGNDTQTPKHQPVETEQRRVHLLCRSNCEPHPCGYRRSTPRADSNIGSLQGQSRKNGGNCGQSRISEETAEIAEVDSEEDAIIVYINATIRNAKSSPLSDKKVAGTTLYNATKPYIGIQRLPQRQQVQKVSGLLSDLAKEEVASHLETLGLIEEVERLDTLNARYLSLLTSRADSQIANAVEASKPIRTEMDAQYDEMITTAWAFSIATPSDALTNFIAFLNKLIDDTNTAYNQRMAQSGKKEETKNDL